MIRNDNFCLGSSFFYFSFFSLFFFKVMLHTARLDSQLARHLARVVLTAGVLPSFEFFPGDF